VNPNRLRPAVAPLALDYMADVLLGRGFEVGLLDLCFEPDPEAAIAQALAQREPALVAVTLRNTDDCFLASADNFLPGFAQIIAAIRRHGSAPIVVGGSGYSVAPAAIHAALGADYGIAGDGEVPLATLADALTGDGDLSAVPGLVWRDGSTLRSNAPWAGSLEDLPTRTRALLDNRHYFAEGGQAGIETKRGCDRACVYCADPLGKGVRVRPRSPKQVADEFEVLLGQGVDHFHLCDSEFNVPADHALAVCEELVQRGIGERACWYTYAKPGDFSPDLARQMRRAGCVGINFGADSGDDRMLAALGRDFRAADLWETADACRQAGLVFMYDLLLGGPGETRESIATTVDLVKRLSPSRAGVSLGVRIYHGTSLSERVRRQGPMVSNPNLRGAVEENEDFLAPVFYLSSALGDSPAAYVAGLVGGDQRFFFPTAEAGTEAYNYSDNERLVEAIERGYRGAYWDILRRLSEEGEGGSIS
jgi:radical SAM superfamily enzyme YgiQ (UPF0313 family)